MRWHHFLVCLLFGLLFLYFSYLPIAGNQIWRSVWQGNWIVENGIADFDPALPLADGTRTVTHGWLGHIAISSLHKLGGAHALTIGFALLQTLALILWAVIFNKLGKRSWAGVVAVFVAVGCVPFLWGLQPAVVCQLLFAGIVLTMTSVGDRDNEKDQWTWEWSSAPTWAWMLVGLLFLLWVNFDVSFVVGLVFAAVLAVSRLIDHFRCMADQSIMQDKELWRRTWLFELFLLLTLVQPIGLGLWQSALWWPENSLVVGMGGWSSLVLVSWPGVTVVTAWVFWIACSRTTSKIPTWSLLTVVAASIGVAVCQNSLVWFALLMAMATFAMLPRTQQTVAEEAPSPEPQSADENRPLKFAFTLFCGLAIWIAFSLSPLGSLALGGKLVNENKLFSRSTPLAAANFLQENKPKGLVFAPAYWGDVLQNGVDIIPVFANSNSLPLQVRQDYDAIYTANAQWRRLMNRYNVTDLLIDKSNQRLLARALRKDPGQWKKMFEDEVSIVFRRERS